MAKVESALKTNVQSIMEKQRKEKATNSRVGSVGEESLEEEVDLGL